MRILLTLLTAGLVTFAGTFLYGSFTSNQDTALFNLRNDIVSMQSLIDEALQLGADSDKFFGGSVYTLAGSGISSTDTSITVTSLTIPQNGYKIQDSDLSDTFFVTLEPGNTTRQEFISCTTVTQNANNATLSGCTRGLAPIAPYTASTTLRFSHAGGAKLIFSDPPQLFDDAAFKDNDETITGVWTYDSSNPPRYSASPTLTGNPLYFASVDYVGNQVNQGAATSSESLGGIAELATQVEMGSSTDLGADRPLVVQAKYSTSSPDVRGVYNIISTTAGFLKQSWLNLTEAFTWTGAHVFNSTVDIEADAGANVTFNTVAYEFPTTDNSSSSRLTTDGSGVLSFVRHELDTYTSLPPFAATTSSSVTLHNSNTAASVQQFTLPVGMTVSKVTVNPHGVAVSNSMDIGIYDKAGNLLLSTSTKTLTSNTQDTSVFDTATYLEPGTYYFASVGNAGSPDISFAAFFNPKLSGGVSGEPVTVGTLTVSAGTLPASFTPSNISVSSLNRAITFRLD
jgi:hypothetical protein